MRYKLKRPWTPEDRDELRRLAKLNWTSHRIATRLKRTVRSVTRQAQLNDIELKAVQKERPAPLLFGVTKSASSPAARRPAREQ